MGQCVSTTCRGYKQLITPNKSYNTLLVSHPATHVLQITLHRPHAANAFNTEMACELYEIFEDLSLDRSDTRCVILTGTGERAFCAGGDLKERNGMSDEDWGKQHLVYERMVRAIINCPTPIIGAINGAAYGGGCEIAAATDFAYADKNARFALTETSLGIIPGAGGTQTLARALGERRCKELILSASPFSAAQAHQWGLINAIYPQEELLPKALEMAQRISNNAPIAVRQAKQSIHRGLQMSLADGMAFEIEAYNRTVPTEDRIEGVLAFNEKRVPDFKNR